MNRREEKAAATRCRFLDATFDSLVELGYHGTSTVVVCERAGLARGTMLHHFPNKQALVLASLEDVLLRRAREFGAVLLEVNTNNLGELVRHFWGAVRGPTFMAWLELAMASRTDPVLDTEFRNVMKRFDDVVTSIAESSLPRDVADGEDLHLFVSLAFSTLNGLALDTLQLEPAEIEAKVELLVRWAEKMQS